MTKLADRVYVLHCFQKRTRQTAGADPVDCAHPFALALALDLAGKRYNQVVDEIRDRQVSGHE